MPTPTVEQINSNMSGFEALLRLRYDACSDEEVRAHLDVDAQIKQPAGLVHGGVYASIAESMASVATHLAVLADGHMAMGQSNHTSFLRPITDGVVHAHATRLHRGRTTWIWDVRFSDDAGRLCAVTRMTIAVRPLPVPAARESAPV